MRVTCPGCARRIPLEDVNVATDVALCRPCGETYSLSALVDPERAAGFDVEDPPPGAWFRDEGGDAAVGATTRSAAAFLLVPFTCAWLGFLGVFGFAIAAARELTFVLFVSPFFAAGAVLVGMSLMTLGGKVEVRMRGPSGEVFTGIGPFGLRRRFELEDVERVREDTEWAYGGNRSRAIVLEGRRRLRLGRMLREDRRYYLLQALKALLSGRPK